jgi:hypothetical protein
VSSLSSGDGSVFAAELAESLAEELLDHFMARGVLANEIKVAEIVELDLGVDDWDTSNEYAAPYTFYGESVRFTTFTGRRSMIVGRIRDAY